MKITVWSSLGGKLSGYLTLNVPPTHTIRKLLEIYCKYKDVTSNGYVMRSRDNLLLNRNETLEDCGIEDGDTLTIGLADDEEQTFGFGSWFMVSIISLVIGAVGMVYAIWTFLVPMAAPLKYGIVMDAGSSHSEIYVYSWEGDKPLNTAEVAPEFRCFMAGGISSFTEHFDDLSLYLEACLNETKLEVPQSQHTSTPFYVEATAGMRILRDFDPEGANLILATLREILMKKTSFKIVHDNIEIIEGSVEGASGWMTVNYLYGYLTKERKPTVATLDVGGASMQITREVEDNETLVPENLTLFKHNYKVLSQTFLCYGIGEAENRYDYFLVNDNVTSENEGVFLDPCLAKGVTHNITLDELNGPCTHTNESKPVLSGVSPLKWHKLRKILKYYRASKEYDSTAFQHLESSTEMSSNRDNEISYTIFINGSSDPLLCNEKMERLFDVNLCRKTFTYGDCFDSEYVPPILGDLVAFSDIFREIMKILGLKQGSSLKDFETTVFEICSLDAYNLYKRFPDIKKVLVEDLCFDATYIYILLTAGLGIDDLEWKRIQFTNTINNTEVAWPMGFMMNRTTAFEAVKAPVQLSIPVFSLLSILFGAFMISGIFFLWHSVKIKIRSTSYQRSELHLA